MVVSAQSFETERPHPLSFRGHLPRQMLTDRQSSAPFAAQNGRKAVVPPREAPRRSMIEYYDP
jgi:hypothetical protein